MMKYREILQTMLKRTRKWDKINDEIWWNLTKFDEMDKKFSKM